MRISSNDMMIKRRSRMGMYASLGGLAVLVVGMVASFRPNLLWLSLGAIVIGFILAQYGNYSLRRWGRSPRPDQVLTNAMKGFDDRYHFYSWSLPAPYVLLTPNGLFSFVTRDQTGQITVRGSNWKSKFSIGRMLLLFAQEGLGNPTRDAEDNAARLSDWIRKEAPDLSVDVEPAIIFIDDRAQLDVEDAAVPVLAAKGLKKWLRTVGKTSNLSVADYRKLEAMFGG